jgi:hypothetical protein
LKPSKFDRRGRTATKTVKYSEEEAKVTIEGAQGLAKFLPYTYNNGSNSPVFPEWSGKMFVLYRLMKEMRKPGTETTKLLSFQTTLKPLI